MSIRIGEVMVRNGLLNEGQVAAILEAQTDRARPFGQLAEEMFGVCERQVEQAWVEQYASITRHVDPTVEPIDPKAVGLIERRQAWQFRVMPIRFDGRELMLATTTDHLLRALRFASRCLGIPSYLVLCDGNALGQALTRHYPMAGMSATSLSEHTFATLLAREDEW